jgi:hypothetical protein
LHTVDPSQWESRLRVSQRLYEIAEPLLRSQRNANVARTGAPEMSTRGKMWLLRQHILQLRALAAQPGEVGEQAARMLPEREHAFQKLRDRRNPLNVRLEHLNKESALLAGINGVNDI